MKKILSLTLFLLLTLTALAKENTMNIYDFTVQDIDAKAVSMSK